MDLIMQARIERQEKYCRTCGQPLQYKNGVNFDPKTGQREQVLVCGNLNCETGCSENGGHMQSCWSLSERCKRCGWSLGF